jgi:hypothetical protein
MLLTLNTCVCLPRIWFKHETGDRHKAKNSMAIPVYSRIHNIATTQRAVYSHYELLKHAPFYSRHKAETIKNQSARQQ